MNISDHTTKAFDTDLIELTQMVARMGGSAQQQISGALEALLRRDVELANHVIASDAAIDNLQQQVEQKAIATIALRQPMAIDLRALVAMMRIANDLERIGDLAKNIGKRAIAIHGDNSQRSHVRGLKHMVSLVESQLSAVLDSFVNRDPCRALKVWENDKDIDAMHVSLFRELLTYTIEDPGAISTCIQLLFCVKNVERIGDHATNIAEAVHYMIEGHQIVGQRPKGDNTGIFSDASQGTLMPTMA
jgi:phosphate transport system protein